MSEDQVSERLTAIDLVLEQANDEGLWFIAEIITEAYLQQALRKLHWLVEQEAGAVGRAAEGES